MTIHASGSPIYMSEVNTELGAATTTARTLNDAAVRTLFGAGASGTAIALGTGYGKSNRVTVTLTPANGTKNYNIFSNKGGTYVAGKTDIILNVTSGYVIGSTSTGTYALQTGTGWTSGDTITINNAGYIAGHGGNGGGYYTGGGGAGNTAGVLNGGLTHGGTAIGSGPFRGGGGALGNGGGGGGGPGGPPNGGNYTGDGGAGGPSLYLQWPVSINNTSGYIYSGGGGGAGGTASGYVSAAGGGGGGASGGGIATHVGSDDGNPTGPSFGGGHGLAITRNGNTINGQSSGWTWPGNGRVYGGIG